MICTIHISTYIFVLKVSQTFYNWKIMIFNKYVLVYHVRSVIWPKDIIRNIIAQDCIKDMLMFNNHHVLSSSRLNKHFIIEKASVLQPTDIIRNIMSGLVTSLFLDCVRTFHQLESKKQTTYHIPYLLN